MRWNLLKTYDKIYTIDLHGNSNKQETSPDGSTDVNVFDIQQGVSINIFVKTGKKKAHELGKVFHFDLYGKREDKYDFLFKNSLRDIPYTPLSNAGPNYFFVLRDAKKEKVYETGFSVNELFTISSIGIVTSKDAILINDSKTELLKIVGDFYSIEVDANLVKEISYRPFDNKYIYYNTKIIERAREKVMQHFLNGNNIGLITARSNKSDTCDHFYITKTIMETKCGERTTQSAVFPLYLYPETSTQQTLETQPEKIPNFNEAIIEAIEKSLNHILIPEGIVVDLAAGCDGTFTPVELLDYIYAVLHSPTYREKYKEFLKIDFPRVPYPKNQKTFWQLIQLGSELRKIHLLECPVVNKPITKYPVDGDNVVGKTKYDAGNVYINDTQYFAQVPQTAWQFYIGGYQPAQKWLKDRKGRKLEFEDILHYQKIIVALTETARLMKEIDKVEIE